MLPDIECLQQCKQLIEQNLDWGNSSNWQTADFDNLQQRILEATGVSLSVSTLMRIWGRVKYDHLPSATTLNTLAQFAGFESWRAFVKQQNEKTEVVAPTTIPVIVKPANRTRLWSRIAVAVVIVAVVAVVGLFAIRKPSPLVTDTSAYSFSSEPLTRSIPNSVVFTYDASAAPTDSVYIQQSWDPKRRVWADKKLHKHTSIYYEPGFYEAKLLVGQQIVKEHRLIIPTNNWMAGIFTSNAKPVYLKPSQFTDSGVLRVPVSVIKENNIALQPYAPTLKYYNVGNFAPVPVSDFSYTAQVKNEYAEGAAACQYAYIAIITDAAPIIIQLAIKGCSAELMERNIDSVVNGKNADLSGFGVDFNDWATFSCSTTDSSIVYRVNGKVAYTFPKPSRPVNIVGIGFGFGGTGAVKNIQLSSKGKIAFEAFR